MRLLVVEDEPDLLAGLARALRKKGMRSIPPRTAGRFEKARDTEYDAVVLDVMLPAHGRLDRARRLRETRKTPVLMLTARDRTPTASAGSTPGRMTIW